MIYLILSIICSAAIAIVMRAAERKTENNITMLSVNYLACSILAGIFAAGAGGLIPGGPAGRYAVLLGLGNGILYLGCFLMLQKSIQRNGVILSQTFTKLGVLVPTVSAVLLFGERPGILQILGILIALIAILVVNFGGRPKDRPEGKSGVAGASGVSGRPAGPGASGKLLILLLLVGGSADAMSKVYEETGETAYKSQFLFFTFLSALILSILAAKGSGQGFTREDAFYGALLGLPNYFSSRFLLLSLGHVPAVIAYPTYSVGTIIVVTLISVFFLREKQSARQWAATGMILFALVLLNL